MWHIRVVDYRPLGSHGPAISVVGFGAAPAGGDLFGPNDSDESVVNSMRTAVDAGMNWIDTSETYGSGRSEELVGKAVLGRRDQVMVFTKVSPKGWGGSGVRRQEVRRAVRGSLRRLQLDYLDLYQVHAVDPAVPLEETWEAMSSLVDEGLVRYIGLSNVGPDALDRCERLRRVDSVQNEFSLARPGDRVALLPRLAALGTGYLAYGPLAYGLLTGAITSATVFPDSDWRGAASGGGIWRRLYAPNALPGWLARVEQGRALAGRLRRPLGTLAIAWVLAQPGVTAAIVGSRDPGHVRANASAAGLRLQQDTLVALDAIFQARPDMAHDQGFSAT